MTIPTERLVQRLRGEYTVPVSDGAGPLNESEIFTRNFGTPPIHHKAAEVIELMAQWIIGRPDAPADMVRLSRKVLGLGPLCVGDIVEPVRLHQLYSSTGTYEKVVVVSTDPFTLASQSGDMLWQRLKPTEVRFIGRAGAAEWWRAFERWESK